MVLLLSGQEVPLARKALVWPKRSKLAHAVGKQLQRAGAGPTSGPTRRPPHVLTQPVLPGCLQVEMLIGHHKELYAPFCVPDWSQRCKYIFSTPIITYYIRLALNIYLFYLTRGCSVNGVRSARKTRVGPCIPVGTQPQRAAQSLPNFWADTGSSLSPGCPSQSCRPGPPSPWAVKSISAHLH